MKEFEKKSVERDNYSIVEVRNSNRVAWEVEPYVSVSYIKKGFDLEEARYYSLRGSTYAIGRNDRAIT